MDLPDIGGSDSRNLPSSKCRQDMLLPEALVFLRRSRFASCFDVLDVGLAELPDEWKGSSSSSVGRRVEPLRNPTEFALGKRAGLIWRQRSVIAQSNAALVGAAPAPWKTIANDVGLMAAWRHSHAESGQRIIPEVGFPSGAGKGVHCTFSDASVWHKRMSSRVRQNVHGLTTDSPKRNIRAFPGISSSFFLT